MSLFPGDDRPKEDFSGTFCNFAGLSIFKLSPLASLGEGEEPMPITQVQGSPATELVEGKINKGFLVTF